jgi:hypothetical protein
MIKRIIAALLLVLFMVGPVMAETFNLDLLDISRSEFSEVSPRDSPFARDLEELKAQIGQLSKDDVLLVYGFGKSRAQLLKVIMPHIAGPKGVNLAATREAATRKLMENIREKTGAINKSRTDLIGALELAARVFSEIGIPSKRLVLYSDTLDTETLGLSLKKLTLGSHKKYLKRLDTMRIPYPDLKNVKVDIYGAFAAEKDIDDLQTELALSELKQFWTAYFRRCGAQVSVYRTSLY